MKGTSALQPSPFIKWAGGKQAVADKIISFFPASSTVDTYYEPFLGGGSVFFAYTSHTAVLNDSNRWLIDTYKAIRDDWVKVAEILISMPNTKAAYLHIRSLDPFTKSIYERAATFIYLNKTCFRGLFRVNKQGKFNVPYGAYDRRYFDPENLRFVSQTLRKTQLLSTDFELAISEIGEKDFVYFDPPYHPIGGYSDFKRYTSEQFREKDHIRLASLCAELDKKGIRWVASNSDTPFIHSLYQNYGIHKVGARREINLDSQNRNITELVITNIPEQDRIQSLKTEQLTLAL